MSDLGRRFMTESGRKALSLHILLEDGVVFFVVSNVRDEERREGRCMPFDANACLLEADLRAIHVVRDDADADADADVGLDGCSTFTLFPT